MGRGDPKRERHIASPCLSRFGTTLACLARRRTLAARGAPMKLGFKNLQLHSRLWPINAACVLLSRCGRYRSMRLWLRGGPMRHGSVSPAALAPAAGRGDGEGLERRRRRRAAVALCPLPAPAGERLRPRSQTPTPYHRSLPTARAACRDNAGPWQAAAREGVTQCAA